MPGAVPPASGAFPGRLLVGGSDVVLLSGTRDSGRGARPLKGIGTGARLSSAHFEDSPGQPRALDASQALASPAQPGWISPGLTQKEQTFPGPRPLCQLHPVGQTLSEQREAGPAHRLPTWAPTPGHPRRSPRTLRLLCPCSPGPPPGPFLTQSSPGASPHTRARTVCKAPAGGEGRPQCPTLSQVGSQWRYGRPATPCTPSKGHWTHSHTCPLASTHTTYVLVFTFLS